jgi:hypothetical protein
MKKLIFLVLIALVAWYGWKHLPGLLEKRPSHEAVIQNHTGSGLLRVRLTVDGQTFVKEDWPTAPTRCSRSRVGKDASFTLVWQWADRVGESNWGGGMVPAGPMVQRHTMTIDSDGGVVYQAAAK